ncbi:tetratricopeptide repeat protein [Desulfobacterales bacterium HSG2]|nr:tetratricopeptide repeat protein [Desulfobacterales bacterium HSG2]
MAKAKKKRGKRKAKGQNSGLIPLNERRDKIIRLVKKKLFDNARLQIARLKESLAGNPDLLSKNFNYIAKKIIAYSKKINISGNAVELYNHGTVLLELDQYEAAIENYEQALNINPRYINALVNCGYALGELGRYEEAIEKSEQAMNVDPNHIGILNNYGSALGKLGRYEEAIEKFEQALNVDPDDIKILHNYGSALGKLGRYEGAIEKFEQALNVDPNHIKILNNYGNALGELGRHEEAIEKYDQALNIDPNDTDALLKYGNALDELNRFEEAIEKFEQALNVDPNDIGILNNYGSALGKLGRHEEAIEKFKQALNVDPDDIGILNNYGNALGKLGRHEEAIEKFEQALNVNPNYYVALINYGITLVYSGQYDKAAKKLEKAGSIAPGEPTTLFLHAMLLQREGKYDDAISALLKIDQNTLSSYNANVLYLSLGRLYYLIKLEEEGNRYFELAIEQSEDKDAVRIAVARHIFADNPYSQEGVEILLEIAENSPRYAEAFKILTLNLSLKDYYRMFYTHSEAGLHDTEMLNRSIYHKIGNEISILKGTAQRILYLSQAKDEMLSEIVESIEEIIEQIRTRREHGKRAAKAIPGNDYEKLTEIISETAHDISDFVNNEMGVIESRIRRVMWRLPKTNSRYPQFEGLLEQIEFAKSALNDLKSINEGIRIRHRRFRVKKLFEKWEKNRNLANARIDLDIQNGDATFDGDEEKIKSMLNELVENSLKHNSGQTNLEICITAKDTTNMPPIRDSDIPGQQRYLFIEFRDNGQGIAKNRKHRIFLPLETTSPDGEGSGLGLFIIKKTLTQMKGHIRESGKNGAKFEIYIPYPEEEENEYIERYRQYSFAAG